MKVLRKICPHCGYVMLFSVEVLCRPNTAALIGTDCPCCQTQVGLGALATEIDMEEVTDDPDVAAVMRSINRFAN